MRIVVLILAVLGAWVLVMVAIAVVLVVVTGRRHAARLRAWNRDCERLTELAARDRLRPRSGNVEASPVNPPVAPALTNGRGIHGRID